MSVLSTLHKGYLTMKTASGYVKLLPRTLASLVTMANGKTVESEITTINNTLNDKIRIVNVTSPKNIVTINAHSAMKSESLFGASFASLIPFTEGYDTALTVNGIPNGSSGVIVYTNGWIYNATNSNLQANSFSATWQFMLVKK